MAQASSHGDGHHGHRAGDGRPERHTCLNQARMDHEFLTRPGDNFNSTLPYVDFRLYDDVLTDTTSGAHRAHLGRSRPGPAGLGHRWISGTHYWRGRSCGLQWHGIPRSPDLRWRCVHGHRLGPALAEATRRTCCCCIGLTLPTLGGVSDHTVNLGNPNDGNGPDRHRCVAAGRLLLWSRQCDRLGG